VARTEARKHVSRTFDWHTATAAAGLRVTFLRNGASLRVLQSGAGIKHSE